MEITGTIIRIQDTQTFDSGFSKRALHLEIEPGRYPQIIELEFVKDKCSMLDSYAPGQEVKVDVNLRGREWTSPKGELRVFNTLQAWRIEDVGGSKPVPNDDVGTDSTDEIPF